MTLIRFDIPEPVQAMIKTAIEYDVIDAIGFYALATKFGSDWAGLANELTEIAYADINAGGGTKHREIVNAAEKVWLLT